MRVLAALGLDDEDALVLSIAARRAREGGSLLARKGEIGICHVVREHRAIRPLFPQRELATVGVVSRAAEHARAALEARARMLLPDVENVSFFLEHGEPYAEVVRRAESWKADVVVVGARRKQGIAAAFLGGVADRVVRYAHAPVIVARNVREHGHVVAATDMSDPSLPAIEAGYAEAKLRGGGFSIVHVLPPPAITSAPYGAALPVTGPSSHEVTEETRTLVESHIRNEMKERLGITDSAVQIRVLMGPPAASIVSLTASRDAELVVVGTRGRTGLSRILLGSIAEEVVRTAPCSVLAVRLAPPS